MDPDIGSDYSVMEPEDDHLELKGSIHGQEDVAISRSR